MKSRDRRIAIFVACFGVGACAFALLHFVGTIVDNGLAWSPQLTARDHYLAVGNSYSQGFIVGFFLCFSLSVLAVALGSWLSQGRRAQAPRESEPSAPVDMTERLRDQRHAEAGGGRTPLSGESRL